MKARWFKPWTWFSGGETSDERTGAQVKPTESSPPLMTGGGGSGPPTGFNQSLEYSSDERNEQASREASETGRYSSY